MGIIDKVRALFLTKSDKPPVADVNPWEDAAPTPQENVNPWKEASFKNTPRIPHPVKIDFHSDAKPKPVDNVWVKPGRGFKENVLRKASFLLIVLNIAIGLLFYSNNLQFNLALYAYLGASTLVVGHYISLTR
jgi:hypothetical protein